MATFTTRMGLTKPLGTEPRSVVPINANSDLLDAFMPCILVNDGVTPPTAALYDGAIVREKTSGKTWEARKNGGGTFDAKWIVYPWSIKTFNTGPVLSSGAFVQNIGVGGFVSGINSSGASLSGSPANIVAPVTGIYTLRSLYLWASNATGERTASFIFNGVNPQIDNESAVAPVPGGALTRQVNAEVVALTAGDTIGLWGHQSSGGALSVDTYASVALITPRTP